MGTTPPPATPFVSRRAYPRLKYETPVEIAFAGRSIMGTIEDIGIGGLGLRCEAPPPKEAEELGLLFNLPTGSSVRTDAVVRYVLPNRFGVQFKTLSPGARLALREYTNKILCYVRRGERVAKRFHVTLRRMTSDATSEELAETTVLNHYGGRLICRARFDIGEELRLYWPEKHREAHVRIVHRQPCGTGTLIEFGFEFIDQQKFWEGEL